MNPAHFFRRALCLLALVFLSHTSKAAPGCPDAGIFGSSLISDICWSCMLPVKMMGVGGGDIDPPGSNTNPMCVCNDPLGLPIPGFTMGAWAPYRIFEVVRSPFCSPLLGGIFISDDWTRLAGPGFVHTRSSGPHSATNYHTHVFSFPLLVMLELLTSKHCNAGGYQDMDLIMLSEFDPTSTDDMLAMFIYFETALFANPTAVAACAIECGALGAGVKPSTLGAWWCAGCWGGLYPMTNTSSVRASLHSETSLVAARNLAIKHRRGLGQRTFGSDAMCGGQTHVFLPKEQYRWQHLFPVPQARKPCCHWTGTSEYQTGGVSRSRPVVGEDAVHLLFRYADCCLN